MLVKTLEARDLRDMMVHFDRDYFSFEGYSEIIDYFDGFGEPVEVDPIAIACEFTEDAVLSVWEDYGYLFPDFPRPSIDSDEFSEWCNAFVEELNWYTWAILLDNGCVLYRDF